MMRTAVLVAIFAALAPAASSARVVPVATAVEVRTAIAGALPGDEIVLAAGDYTFTANLSCNRAGTAGTPIVVRAAAPGCVFVHMDTVEGFLVSAPYWTFEGLDIDGICADDSSCEHAFHVV